MVQFLYADKKPGKETNFVVDDPVETEYNDDDDENDDEEEIQLPAINQKPEIIDEIDELNKRLEDREYKVQACDLTLISITIY